MNKFEELDKYLEETRTCYDWHGEEYNLELKECIDSDVDFQEEIRKAFLAGFDLGSK